MSLSDVGTVIAILSAVISLAGVVYLAGVKLARLEVKVDTIWDFIMRRALSEALNKGVATMNSPVEVTAEAKGWLTNFARPLREFYRTIGKNLPEQELSLEIEKRWGEQLLKEVCIPRNLHSGACLVIAIHVAREPDTEPQPTAEKAP